MAEELDVQEKQARIRPSAPGDWRHSWRACLGGLISVGVGVWDAWQYGRERGLGIEIDEGLIFAGVYLISGIREVIRRPTRGGQ
jgi:hypothetical protein